MSSADQCNATADRVFVKPPVSRHAVTLVPITVFPDMGGHHHPGHPRIFGCFMSPASPYIFPNHAFHAAAGGLGFTLMLFLWLVGHDGDKT